MPRTEDLSSTLLEAWRTSCQVTDFLVAGIPDALWDESIPGSPRRTFRTILVHLHNARSRWIRTLGQEHGIKPPVLMNPRRATRKQLLAALETSARGIEQILELGIASGGEVPPSRGYVWRNLPLDVGHVLAYFVAHEAHHRGQLVVIARALEQRLPAAVTNGLWQWSTFVRERTRPRRLAARR